MCGEGVGVVAEAVEQRDGQPRVAEDLDPFGECEFGRDDRGAPLEVDGEQVEEQFATGLVEGDSLAVLG